MISTQEYNNILSADSAGAYFATMKHNYKYKFLGTNIKLD